LNPKIENSWRTYEIWSEEACQISQNLDSRKIIWKQDYSLDSETKTSGASLRPRVRRINAFPSKFLAHFAHLRRPQFPKTKSTNFHAAIKKKSDIQDVTTPFG